MSGCENRWTVPLVRLVLGDLYLAISAPGTTVMIPLSEIGTNVLHEFSPRRLTHGIKVRGDDLADDAFVFFVPSW
jgi:hypothetical protein